MSRIAPYIYRPERRTAPAPVTAVVVHLPELLSIVVLLGAAVLFGLLILLVPAVLLGGLAVHSIAVEARHRRAAVEYQQTARTTCGSRRARRAGVA